MAKTFNVVIVTPDETSYEGEAISATIPGLAGYIGIWANHAPLVAAVVPGVVMLKKDDLGSELRMAVGAGFVEVSDNVVNLMVDTCEKDSEIDVARASEALKRARQKLESMEEDLDRERARMALARAEARLRASGREKK